MKRYIVRLTEEERKKLREVVQKNEGSSHRVKRAMILLKSDAQGPGWSDKKIAEAFDYHTQGIASIRRRFVVNGLDRTLYCRHLFFSHSIPGRLRGPGCSWPGQRKNSSGMGLKFSKKWLKYKEY